MTEQNKKDSRLQLNEGTIYVDAESITFKPQAFKAYDDKQNLEQNKKVTELEEQVQSPKKQLASHELRIESAERKITELRMDYEKLITKRS